MDSPDKDLPNAEQGTYILTATNRLTNGCEGCAFTGSAASFGKFFLNGEHRGKNLLKYKKEWKGCVCCVKHESICDIMSKTMLKCSDQVNCLDCVRKLT